MRCHWCFELAYHKVMYYETPLALWSRLSYDSLETRDSVLIIRLFSQNTQEFKISLAPSLRPSMRLGSLLNTFLHLEQAFQIPVCSKINFPRQKWPDSRLNLLAMSLVSLLLWKSRPLQCYSGFHECPQLASLSLGPNPLCISFPLQPRLVEIYSLSFRPSAQDFPLFIYHCL